MKEKTSRILFFLMLLVYAIGITTVLLDWEVYQLDMSHPALEIYGLASMGLVLLCLYSHGFGKPNLPPKFVTFALWNTCICGAYSLSETIYLNWGYFTLFELFVYVGLYALIYPVFIKVILTLRTQAA